MTCGSKCKTDSSFPPEIQGPASESGSRFNPNACKYRMCCCHVKRTSVVIGIIKLVILGLMIIWLTQCLTVVKLEKMHQHTRKGNMQLEKQSHSQEKDDIDQAQNHHDHHGKKHHDLQGQNYHDQPRKNDHNHPGRKHHDQQDLNPHHHPNKNHQGRDHHRYKKNWIKKLSRDGNNKLLFRFLMGTLINVIIEGVFLGLMLYGIYKQTWGYLVPLLVWQGLIIIVGIGGLATALILMGSHGGIQTYWETFRKPVCCGVVGLVIDAFFFYVLCRCTQYFRARTEALRSSEATGIVVMPVTGMKYIVPDANAGPCAPEYGISAAPHQVADHVPPPPEYQETPPVGFQAAPLPPKPTPLAEN